MTNARIYILEVICVYDIHFDTLFYAYISPLSTNVEIKNFYCSFVGHWMLELYS